MQGGSVMCEGEVVSQKNNSGTHQRNVSKHNKMYWLYFPQIWEEIWAETMRGRGGGWIQKWVLDILYLALYLAHLKLHIYLKCRDKKLESLQCWYILEFRWTPCTKWFRGCGNLYFVLVSTVSSSNLIAKSLVASCDKLNYEVCYKYCICSISSRGYYIFHSAGRRGYSSRAVTALFTRAPAHAD